METLNNLAVGESATIKKIGSVGQTRRRIMDMGLTKGDEVYICLLYTSPSPRD